MTFAYLERHFGVSIRLAGLCGSAAILSCVSDATLAQTVWQNPAAGSWFAGANWSNGVPASDVDATVGNGGTAQLATGGTGQADTLTINVPSSVEVSNGSTLQISAGVGGGMIALDAGTLKSGVATGVATTVRNPLQIGPGGGTIDSNGANALELTGGISGGATGVLSLVNTGAHDPNKIDTILSGSSTFSGSTQLVGPLLVVLAADNAAGVGALDVGAGGNLGLGANVSQTVTMLTGSGIIFGNGFRSPTGSGLGTLVVEAGSFGGHLGEGSSSEGAINYTGTLELVKTTGGTLTLLGQSYYSGGTQIQQGTIEVGGKNALGVGSVAMSDGTTLRSVQGAQLVNDFALTGTTTFDTIGPGSAVPPYSGGMTIAGVISGSGTLVKTGPLGLQLDGANTYSGNTLVQGGHVGVGSNTALGTGTVTFDGGFLAAHITGLTVSNHAILAQTTVFDTLERNLTYAGLISGPGGLTKNGTGVLTLTGSDTYAGATTVSAGALVVDGSITSAATVNNGATIGGRGTVGALNLLTGATLAPGSGALYQTLQVTGNATFATGTTFQVNINAAGQSDGLTVGGTATINGGTVSVLAATGNYAPGRSYTILTATGGRTGQFTAVQSNMAFLTPALSYDAGHVYLDVTQTAPMTSAATSPTQQGVAGAVESLGPGNPVYDAVITQSPDGARQAFTALSGVAHADVPTIAVQGARAVSGTVFDRLWNIPVDGGGDALSALGQFGTITSPALLRCYGPDGTAATPGGGPTTYDTWGQVLGDFGRNTGVGGAPSVTRSLGGFALGVDRKLDLGSVGHWRVGVAGGYTNDSFSSGQGTGRGTIENAFGTVYGGARYGMVDVRLGASYGATTTTVSRTVAFPGFFEGERASYGGGIAQGFGEFGYRFGLPQAVFEPILNGGITHVHEDRYREKGGAAALVGFAQDTDVGFTTLGFRSEVTPFATVPLVARVMLGWEHSYGDLNPGARLAFASGSAAFQSFGTPLDRDAATAEAALVYKASNAVSLSIAYAGQIGRRDRDNSIRGRLDYRF